ncbi:6-phosphogluconate dehydrogenase [Kineococcus radiotolerans]|uniref:6-phosphogluconate dehydrogenase, decarboxylating n=1 Tax=Kineococcus radiotolerans TaxID=131568 RepID=A0A7W4TIX2_KINRA|nr:NADP-dependent phosphogluconate dehydrogenase [Kineococcus radiotolerans]MBB2899784.1 6-phosphogluconate dehydrogenase [Kineococcus radiotolerans]
MTETTTQKAQIGVTGLATMGRNLARNIARHGYVTAVHNRTDAKTKALVEEFGHEGTFVPGYTSQEFVDSLESPRTIIVMVKAGPATDAVIEELAPLLSEGDILVDAGNAHFADTRRREAALRERGVHFAGVGVSGGEEGALLGPSIMPGGSEHAYAKLGPIFADIAVSVDGTPCSTHVGPDGAGHFVKMVHNGIEYADMQLIAEAYDLLRHGLGRTPKQLAEVFTSWNEGDLESFLIEITARVLDKDDPTQEGTPLVDVILDEAEQKGTGRWTVQTALDLGTPVSGIAEAVFARALSGHAEQRGAAQGVLPGPAAGAEGTGGFVAEADAEAFVDDVRAALYASKVVAYAQGFDMIRAGSTEYGWGVDPGAMATIWRGGCIIRAKFLDRIKDAYAHQPDLPSLLLDPYFADAVAKGQEAWRRVVTHSVQAGIPAPGFSSALAYYDALRRDRSSAALIQGLRDLFGAHTYKRTDRAGDFHVDWSGDGTESQG